MYKNKTQQIAKNTIVLYIRMIITMLITLFSSRIVLQALGVSDFGLYNVVGGIVVLLSFLRTSLTSSTQRFLSFEIGRNNIEQLKKVFNVSVSTHILISIIILICAETIGLWFLNNYIRIPEGREIAANFIYQFSVISLCLSTLTVPYNASVISHECMSYYAIVTIIESLLKLLFSYALFIYNYDKLILYGGLMMLVNLLSLIMYWAYCRLNYCETKYCFYFEKSLFKQIFSFSSWTIIGQLAVIGANQGTSVLINIFHSVTANAAIAIGQQVNNAISGLTANFQTAFQPQLTKSYASNDFDYLNSLICKASKISYFLLFLVSLPIMLNIDTVLHLWLGDVPKYSGTFAILFIIASLFNSLSAPLWIGIYATGKIKNYQILVSAIFFVDIIIVYLLFKYYDFAPTIALFVKAIINFIVVFVRVYFTQKQIPGFSFITYLKKVLVPVLIVSTVSLLLVLILMNKQDDSLLVVSNNVIIFVASLFATYFAGFTRGERNSIISMIKYKIKK